jgi:hypothetical protein
MFVQHTFIEEPHKSTLEQIIRQHNVVTESYLAKFYRAAFDTFLNAAPVALSGMVVSRIANDKHVVASVTDERTGFYLQLAGEAKNPNQGKQITVGMKWAMQGKADNLSTTATKMW